MTDDHRRVESVIFDMDGLMVDSEPLAIEAWQRCLTPLGANLPVEQFHRLIGVSHEDTLRYITQWTGVAPEIANAGFWNNLLALVGERGKPADGLVPLLDELETRGYPLGVASNSPIVYVRHVTDILAVTKHFKCMVGADEVPHPKPAPDVYIQAARCLGVPPESCLAFEDSSTGASAALAAGMRCVLVPSLEKASSDPDGVYAVVPSLSACHARLDELLTLNSSPADERRA
jgi:HAD superfamily hydrolase (TIGR01509 family)